MSEVLFDQDALLASTDLIRRTGAKSFEVGYLDDTPGKPDWWAAAQYRGSRVIVEHHGDPIEAAEALARRLLQGAGCRRCGEPISLNDSQEGCRWRRVVDRWVPGCDKEIDQTIEVKAFR